MHFELAGMSAAMVTSLQKKILEAATSESCKTHGVTCSSSHLHPGYKTRLQQKVDRFQSWWHEWARIAANQPVQVVSGVCVATCRDNHPPPPRVSEGCGFLWSGGRLRVGLHLSSILHGVAIAGSTLNE